MLADGFVMEGGGNILAESDEELAAIAGGARQLRGPRCRIGICRAPRAVLAGAAFAAGAAAFCLIPGRPATLGGGQVHRAPLVPDTIEAFWKASGSKAAAAPGGGGGQPGAKRGGFLAGLRAKLGKLGGGRKLTAAEKLYSEDAASAMGAFAKLSYCGQLPGVYAAAATTCSDVSHVGTASVCERSGVTVIPGLVRTVSANDHNESESVFGLLARVKNTTADSPFTDGVVIAVRGSVDNFANSIHDKQTRMVDGTEGCKFCKVHQGAHEAFTEIRTQLMASLGGLACMPGSCTVYVTGHASGASMAALMAWDLSESNYTIGTSYLFESPRVGNKAFTKAMTDRFDGQGKDGAIFAVTAGGDRLTRWPSQPEFKSWGIEAHYKTKASKTKEPLCWAGRQGCGVATVPKAELESKSLCAHPKAPDGNFCNIKGFAAQCYGGLSHQYVLSMPLLWNFSDSLAGQPDDQEAASWYPAESNGEQQRAEKDDQREAGQNKSAWRTDFYSLETLKAFSALAKLTYCSDAPGGRKAIRSTCNVKRGVCKAAGFGVVPRTVVRSSVPYQSELTNPYFSKNTLFFYTALLRRSNAKFAKKPFFMPSEACVLAFRGTVNLQNTAMNKEVTQIGLNDTDCKGCTANEGVLGAWKGVLESRVLAALDKSGCEANPSREKTAKVFLVGHSMGGQMATLAAYFLYKRGFDVQLSWMIEAGRPGNMAFMDYISEALSKDRPVPYWVVTHSNDKIPRTGSSEDYVDASHGNSGLGRSHFMVHFNSSNANKPVFCMGKRGTDKDSTCGIYQFNRSLLEGKVPSTQHCNLPFAPGGNICMFQTSTEPEYQLVPQCFYGGSLS